MPAKARHPRRWHDWHCKTWIRPPAFAQGQAFARHDVEGGKRARFGYIPADPNYAAKSGDASAVTHGSARRAAARPADTARPASAQRHRAAAAWMGPRRASRGRAGVWPPRPGSNRFTRSRRRPHLVGPGQHQVFHPRLGRAIGAPIGLRRARPRVGDEHRAARLRRCAAADRRCGSGARPRLRLTAITSAQSFGRMCATGVRRPSAPAVCTSTSSRPKRWWRLGPIASIWSPSARSSGSSVALPPTARIASSVSSRPPWVRAVITTCAPSRASSTAVAAPMPRLAPVTSAMAPVRAALHSAMTTEWRQLQWLSASRLSCRSELSA